MPKKNRQPTASPTPALDALEAWMNAPVQDSASATARWAPVFSLVVNVTNREGQVNIDPFLLPLA